MPYNKRYTFNSMLISKLKIREEDLSRAINRFRLKFKEKSNSWINRCIQRLIDVSSPPKPNTWVVRGDPY